MATPKFTPNQQIISLNGYALVTDESGYLNITSSHDVNSGWPTMTVTYATSYSKAGVTMDISSENIENVKDAADYAEVITRAAIAYSVISVEVLHILL